METLFVYNAEDNVHVIIDTKGEVTNMMHHENIDVFIQHMCERNNIKYSVIGDYDAIINQLMFNQSEIIEIEMFNKKKAFDHLYNDERFYEIFSVSSGDIIEEGMINDKTPSHKKYFVCAKDILDNDLGSHEIPWDTVYDWLLIWAKNSKNYKKGLERIKNNKSTKTISKNSVEVPRKVLQDILECLENVDMDEAADEYYNNCFTKLKKILNGNR